MNVALETRFVTDVRKSQNRDRRHNPSRNRWTQYSIRARTHLNSYYVPEIAGLVHRDGLDGRLDLLTTLSTHAEDASIPTSTERTFISDNPMSSLL